MKVLVTGGAGFIGSHIVDKLLAAGCRVVVLDNFSTGLRTNLPQGIELVEMDLGSEQLLPLFQREHFDYVIHQAAQTMVPKSLDDPHFDCRVNILGTVNLLEACRKTGVKRITAASSAAVYGDVDTLPVVETTVVRPTSFYGLSKLTVERYLALYQELYGLEYAALRYANVYGERQGDAGEGGVVSIFTRKMAAQEPVNIFGDGGQTRDFIYVGDVAAANYAALLATDCNRVYNISTQTETSVNTLIDVMSEVLGRSVTRNYLPAREGDIYRSSLSNAAAVHDLKWQPQTDLVKGLARTIDYFSCGRKS
ncbi:NAD-dependent epimerase/dehydratase family protein [Lucifera butyrica]|nr:NAD-dependent epimerase/dehydratase family protein [Lucifera butyrica]